MDVVRIVTGFTSHPKYNSVICWVADLFCAVNRFEFTCTLVGLAQVTDYPIGGLVHQMGEEHRVR